MTTNQTRFLKSYEQHLYGKWFTGNYVTNNSQIHSPILHNYIHKYITNTSQIHHKYITNTSKYIHKYFTNTSQIYLKYFTNTSKYIYKYLTMSQILQNTFTNT
jgi:hypothetical protein